jgi:ribosomal protein S18 acetylase RimI-like enzyme
METRIERLAPEDYDAHVDGLARLLSDCVHDGASVSFVLPLTLGECQAFWRGKVRPGVVAGTRDLLIARHGGRIVGTVHLDRDTPPNQPHRAEVVKLLVHPDCRRRGIARALMTELERLAVERERTLITLDTRAGDSAEPLYLSLGFEIAGIIPDYALDPFGGKRDPVSFMFKQL